MQYKNLPKILALVAILGIATSCQTRRPNTPNYPTEAEKEAYDDGFRTGFLEGVLMTEAGYQLSNQPY